MAQVPVRPRSVTSLSLHPPPPALCHCCPITPALESSEVLREQPLRSSSDELRPDLLIVLFGALKKAGLRLELHLTPPEE